MSVLVIYGKNFKKISELGWVLPYQKNVDTYSLLSSIEQGEFCEDLFNLLNTKIANKNKYDLIYLIGVASSFNSENIVRLLISTCGMLTSNNLIVIEPRSYTYDSALLINRVCSCLDIECPVVSISTNSIAEMQFRFSTDSIPHYSIRHKSGYIVDVINATKVSTIDALNLIRNSFKEKSGFSFIRINHCENRLWGFEYTFGKSDVNDTYSIQFGEQLDSSDSRLISGLIGTAVRNASLLGVPVLSHLTNRKLGILENSTFVHLRDNSLLGVIPLTDVNIHLKLFAKNEFGDFLKTIPRVIVITCRNSAAKILESQLGIDVHIIPIPGEFKFSSNHDSHYKNHFRNVMSQIENFVKPGDVVLIGAGILGKIYCDKVKEMDGIGIDIGSLFDAIAGEQTRGSGFPDIEWIQKGH
ncbi:hypothetical protein Q7I20_00285 [Aeromonas veronii]|uniref:GT-D fold domain-containing protein n=1 Tax=Aeromonas veronii TaxID=654 RepID=UPI003004CD9B